MNPWLFPWSDIYKWPLSGNVTQDISPASGWLSPQFEFNFAGDRKIESEVVSEVASYGKQLGILSEALLEIANGDKGPAVDKLEALVSQINSVIHQHEDKLEQKVKTGLEQLKQTNPELLKKLLEEYR